MTRNDKKSLEKRKRKHKMERGCGVRFHELLRKLTAELVLLSGYAREHVQCCAAFMFAMTCSVRLKACTVRVDSSLVG